MNTREKILIVDDMPKNIQLLGSILREKGYDIAFAKSGKEAIERVKNNSFDLILLDIMMPEMDGFEVCYNLKSNNETKGIPIIFLTAKNDTESTIKGFESGAVDYVTKPFNSIELLARVRTHLALKKANESLMESNIKLKELNQTKDKFFAIIAHDIRTPLVSFKGLTDMLNTNYESFTEGERKQFLQSMNESAKQLFVLFDNLMEWSQLQSGRIKFAPTEFNAYQIIDQIISLLTLNSSAKEIKIYNGIESQLNIYGDKQMFATIIRNLLSNAIKFSNTKGIIEITNLLKDEFQVFQIKDNGIGIDDEVKSKLFKPEEHITRLGTKNEKGTGLGLILCKEFVERNQGKIWVESQLTKGSSFYFTFPQSKTTK